MAITHAAVKTKEDRGYASEWNADHVVDDNSKPKNNTTLIVAASDSLDTTRADYVCDGVEDEVQINQAIQALPANGGRVSLLEGRFQIKTQVLMNVDNVALVGCGKATELDVTVDTTGTDPVLLDAVDACLVENIFVKGIGAVPAVTQDGILVDDNCTNCMVRDCWVENMDYVGIHLGFVTGCTVQGCNVTTCIQSGLGISFGSYNSIVGNVASGNIGHNFNCWDAHNNIVTGNTFNSSTGGTGIWMSGNSTNCSFTDNECSGNKEHGIVLQDCDNFTIQGCQIHENERAGIYLARALDNIIDGNQIKDNDVLNTATWDGITVDDNSNNNTITSNRCQDNDNTEIRIEDNTCDRNTILGNNCRGVDHVAAIADNGTNTINQHNQV